MARTSWRLLATVGAVALVATTACTPKPVGTTGVTRGTDGEPVLLGQVCDDEIDRASLIDHDLSRRVVEWSDLDAAGSLTLRLDGRVELRPGVSYSFGARSTKGWRVLDDVTFTTADLDALGPGEVRTTRGATLPDVETFRGTACP